MSGFNRIPNALVRVALASSLLAVPLGVASCVDDSGPVIEAVDETAETTSALTPLERGKLRREVLDHAREFISAWKDSDAEALEALLPEQVADLFTDVWDDYADKGLSVRHVHDLTSLDVTEFNQTATQATVSYVYKDTSYLVDEDGAKAKNLPPLEPSLTITFEREPDGGEWKIVRMFVKAEGYR